MERALRKTLDTIRRDVREHRMWCAGTRLLVACSGGVDSMALWALLDELGPSLGHTLVVGHVDHGLQSGAEAAAVVTDRGAVTGHAVLTRRLHLQPGADLQARARAARYGALREMADEAGAAAVVTAHHADDQAETLLMRACRGAGVGALGGIARVRLDGVVRPLLGVDRGAIVTAARLLGVSWWEDPSNRSGAYQRNRFRHEVLPILNSVAPNAATGLARTAENAAGHAEALRHWVGAAVAPHVVRTGRELTLPIALLPEETGLLAPLLAWICCELDVDAPSHAAVRQLAQTLRSTPVRAASGDGRRADEIACRLRGLHVAIGAGQARFLAAAPQSNGDGSKDDETARFDA